MRENRHTEQGVGAGELTEEATKTALHPAIAFRGTPGRAWVIGSGLDVWEIVELARAYHGDDDLLLECHPLVTRRQLHAARAYAEQFPEEIGDQKGCDL